MKAAEARLRTCASKERFGSAQQAENAIYLLALKYPDQPPLRRYTCPYPDCGGYHLSSKPEE